MATKKQAGPKEIRITLDQSGLHYSDAHLHLKPGEQVRWISDDCDYAIFFPASAFTPKKNVIAGSIGKPTSACKAKKLANAPSSEPFKYFVAALAPGANQLVTDDPEIIIDDPGGGGGKKSGKSAKKPAKKTKKR